jgi:tetratricopeptide (TPR) repeat protein
VRSQPLQAPQAPIGSGADALLAALDHEIGLWSASLAANPADFIAAAQLGALHLQRGRITGDLGDYGRALEASDRSVGADPIYWPGHGLRASVLFALHDFSGALDEARATYEADPAQLDALAVIGDASLELGDLAGAEAAYRELGELVPSPPVWSRLAHLAFIRGDPDRALALVEQCVAAVDPGDDASGAAFYRFQLGELHRAAGKNAEAAAAYEASLAALDDYVPALSGFAHVREARGDRPAAIALLERATGRMPQPELVAALGDLYLLDGDPRSEEQYALVERIGELAAASGGAYDRQLILFAADHERGIEMAVAAAEASLETRRDVYGLDAYAWALFGAGRVHEAAAFAGEALAVGTPDPRIAYHAGMIASADGRPDEAVALLRMALAGRAMLPPLQAARAAEALVELEVQGGLE